jgi:hypothetical protein
VWDGTCEMLADRLRGHPRGLVHHGSVALAERLADGQVLRDATEADLSAIVTIYNSTIPTRLGTDDSAPE